MANWNNPTLTSTYTNFVTEVKDRDVEVALWFEGMSPTNLPTNAKRLNTSTGRFEKWNGSAWVDAVGTFTFPALSVAGVSTFTGVATFTANPVINGGTANGVPYLNGSKVLTTGSALTFDGTKLQVAGGDIRVIQASNSANNGLYFRNFADSNTFAKVAYDAATGNLQLGTTQAYDTVFLQNNTEQMRLTPTGLGIGTSSPTQALTIYRGSGLAGGIEVAGNGNTLGSTSFFVGQSSSGDGYVYQRANAPLYFGTNNTTKATLDTAGNLGLGVTPSAWGSGRKILQMTNGAAFGDYSGFTGLSQNYYNNGTSDLYIANGFAARYLQGSGQHLWYTAPSGAAGNAITFTQALTLDASANLISGGTGYWQIPNGTTAQRPTGAAGQIRFNTSLSRYEGHNGTAWSSIGGGATGGGSDDVFYENGQTVTTNYTITTNKNALSAGPITIASGITVTVPSGSTWVVA